MNARTEAIERVRGCVENVEDPRLFDVGDLLAAYDEAVAALAKVTAQRDELRRLGADVVREREYLKSTEMHDNYTDRARSRDREAKAIDRLVLLAIAEQPPAEKAEGGA